MPTAHNVLTKQRPSGYAPAQRNLICVFQVTADGNTAGDSADLKGKVAQTFMDIESCGIAFHGRTQRQDHFLYFDLPVVNALDELLDLEITRSDAVNWRDHSAEYVVQACVLRGILDRHHVAYVFHHTDNRSIASVAGADSASFRVGNVIAVAAELDVSA